MRKIKSAFLFKSKASNLFYPTPPPPLVCRYLKPVVVFKTNHPKTTKKVVGWSNRGQKKIGNECTNRRVVQVLCELPPIPKIIWPPALASHDEMHRHTHTHTHRHTHTHTHTRSTPSSSLPLTLVELWLKETLNPVLIPHF